MKHPNAATLEKFYADLAKNDVSAALNLCTDNMTFQLAGKSRLAGKFTRSSFAEGWAAPLKELSGNTHKLEVHDVMASDLHGTVLATHRLTRSGKTVELRTVHVWRFEGGKPLAGYEYPRDLYQFDAIWS
jgi:ketosteroid isomerase-like protein